MGAFFSANPSQQFIKTICLPYLGVGEPDKFKEIYGIMEVLVEWDGDNKCCQCEINRIMDKLRDVEGIQSVKSEQGSLIIESNLPSASVISTVECLTKKRAVLQGFGRGQAAVSVIKGNPGVMGVIRFQQMSDYVLIDGAIDGLTQGKHGIHVHEIGDLSKGCESIGQHYNPYCNPHGGPDSVKRHLGDLGNITVDKSGKSTFRIVDACLQITDLIGRSIAISEREDDLGNGKGDQSKIDGNSGASIACGIIARSSGIFGNTKRICACDGVVVWEEKGRPLAGAGRRKSDTNTSDPSKSSCCKDGSGDNPNKGCRGNNPGKPQGCCGKKVEPSNGGCC